MLNCTHIKVALSLLLLSHVPLPLKAQLLCHFTLDQATNITPVAEETGNLPGTVTTTDTTIPTLNNGTWDFNNSLSYLQAGPNSTTELMGDLTNTTGMSIAFWMNRDVGAPVFERICGLWGRFDFFFGNNGALAFRCSNIGSYLQYTTSVTDSQWHHVAAVIDYGSSVDNVKLYIDGALVLSDSITINSDFNTPTHKPLIVGARVNGFSHYNGKLDDFRVYGHPLSDTEITNLLSPPAAVYAFEMEQAPISGIGAIDNSAGDLNASLLPSGLPTHIAGGEGMGWDFNGFNGSLQTAVTPITESIGDINSTDGITVGFWIKQNVNHTNWTRVYTLWNTIDALLYNGDIVLRFKSGAAEVRIGGLFDDSWHHIVATADFTSTTDNLNLYVDGNLTVTKSYNFDSSFNTPGKPLIIGASTTGSNSLYSGALDAFLLFTQALDSSQVDQLYNEGSSGFINSAPTVDAGAPQTISLLAPDLQLAGNITDDGSHDIQWSLLSGPSAVTLDNPASATAIATFNTEGEYILQISVDDGAHIASDTVTISVYDDLTPIVDAGAPQYIVLPQNQVTLSGSIEDDGNNASATWVQQSGAAATITAGNTLSPSITLPSIEGEYIFRLIADDGVNSSYSEVSIYVHDAANLPSEPIVDAGSARTVWLPNAELNLSGTYFNGTASSITWSQVQGPGTVTFGQSSNLVTTANFSTEGVYILELEVDASGQVGTDRLVVEVYAETHNFGYTREQLDSYATRELGHEYDYIGFDFSRISPPPAINTHPRVLVNPSDRVDIYNRLTTTAPGIEVWNRIQTRLQGSLTGTGASSIPTQQPSSEDYNELYRQMVAGNSSVFPQVDVSTYLDTNSNPGSDDKDRFVALLAYEAFRCWVEQDNSAATDAAAALTTLAANITQEINTILPTTDYRGELQSVIHRQYIGFAYDFLHPFMSHQQRDSVRATIALATNDMWSIGMDSLPIYGANTSNWVATHAMHLLVNTLAIEGETGSDPDLYPRLVATFERYYTHGLFRSGMTFEGLGKNSITSEAALAMAKRGDRLIALKSVKNHVQKHYTYSMVPWGNRFTWDESLGYVETEGRYVDVPCLKYVYPNDTVIDFAYRNDLGGDSLTRLDDFNIRFPYKAMDFIVRALTAEDWDTTQTWEQALNDLDTLPLDYFCNERGRVISRNDWTSDSLQLHFQPRSALGGHRFEDRNHIIINALGRNWLTRNAYHKVDHEYHSILTIDDEGPSVLPAAMVALYGSGPATIAAGDASIAYNWEIGGTELAEWHYNQFRLLQSDAVDLQIPSADLAHWDTSLRSNTTWQRFNQVEYVYRTAALVRGTHPYILVVDDAKKDESTHEFASRLQLPSDISPSINGLNVTLVPDSGDERMLISVLDAAGSASFSIESNTDGSEALVLKTTAVTPDFKLIFFPHLVGGSTPTISTPSADVWDVSVAGQQDTLSFTSSASGMTDTVIQRQ